MNKSCFEPAWLYLPLVCMLSACGLKDTKKSSELSYSEIEPIFHVTYFHYKKEGSASAAFNYKVFTNVILDGSGAVTYNGTELKPGDPPSLYETRLKEYVPNHTFRYTDNTGTVHVTKMTMEKILFTDSLIYSEDKEFFLPVNRKPGDDRVYIIFSDDAVSDGFEVQDTDSTANGYYDSTISIIHVKGDFLSKFNPGALIGVDMSSDQYAGHLEKKPRVKGSIEIRYEDRATFRMR